MNWYKQAKKFSKKDVLQEIGDDWSDYAKFAEIWVMSIEDARAQNIIKEDGTLNTIEGPQKPKNSDVVCKGKKGEFWNQPEKRLKEKYTKTSDDNPEGKRGRYYGWTEWKPKGEKVEAFKFTKGSFKIDSMNGKEGDWVLRDKNNHSDVWIVDNELFHDTYKKAG